MTDREKQIQIFDKYGNYDFPTDIKQKEHNTATTQIEEMAKVLLETSCKGSECENCAFVKSVKEAKETCVCLKAIYNTGYRKIPEGAVVLTKDEYEQLAIEYKRWEKLAIEDMITQVRKETAREILKELIKNCQYTFNSVGKPIIALSGDFALNVSKRYGVDIEE